VTRAKAAHEALKNAIKQRSATRAKTIAALAECLTTFQKVMTPIVKEIGATAKDFANERISSNFDVGGLINTVTVDGIFGFEIATGVYITYSTGVRKMTSPAELAEFLVDRDPNLDIEPMLNRISAEIEAAGQRIMKTLENYDRIGSSAVVLSAKIKEEERQLLLPAPTTPQALPGAPATKALTG
jgi:hypothetical protein